MVETYWIVRRKRGSQTEIRKTFCSEAAARFEANKLVGEHGCMVELEKAEMGRSHRLHIEVRY